MTSLLLFPFTHTAFRITAVPHGNPAGVVMMMAEKVADMIKQDYNVPIDSTFLRDEL